MFLSEPSITAAYGVIIIAGPFYALAAIVHEHASCDRQGKLAQAAVDQSVNPFPYPGYVPVLDMSTWRTAPASARRVDIAVTQDLVDVCSMMV